MSNPRARTTITIPNRVFNRISTANFNVGRMAVLCLAVGLKKFTRQENLQFNRRSTIKYNPERCSRRVTIWLTDEEHYFLRSWRNLTATSSSYLVVQCIEKYLNKIISMMQGSPQLKFVSEISRRVQNVISGHSLIIQILYPP